VASAGEMGTPEAAEEVSQLISQAVHKARENAANQIAPGSSSGAEAKEEEPSRIPDDLDRCGEDRKILDELEEGLDELEEGGSVDSSTSCDEPAAEGKAWDAESDCSTLHSP
jgi:hypothetical protein